MSNSGHDELCPAHDPNVAPESCRCGLIARVRADEQERKMAAADIAFLDAVQARQALADMRAKVVGLTTLPLGGWPMVFKVDVLALIDEAQP